MEDGKRMTTQQPSHFAHHEAACRNIQAACVARGIPPQRRGLTCLGRHQPARCLYEATPGWCNSDACLQLQMPIEASHEHRRLGSSGAAVAARVLIPAAAAACQQHRLEGAFGHLRCFPLRLLCLAT